MSHEQDLIEEVALSLSSRHLQLIVMPTERCNFRCTYCYESFERGRMSDEIADGLVALIVSRLDGLDSLTLEWFGGEPLVALDRVLDISRRVSDRLRSHPHVEYSASMTTNAWRLDLDTARALVEVGLRSVQVSLDGPREHHDRTRLQAGGRGSFDGIWANLEAIRDDSVELDVLLRVHLTPTNAAAMPRFVDRLADEFLADPRFSILLKAVEHLGGPSDESFEILGHGGAEALIETLHARVDRKRLVSIPAVCYAAKANSLVIRSDGVIAKCTVALDDPRNVVGQLESDGRLTLDQTRLRPWMRGLGSLDLDQIACPLVDLTPQQANTSDARTHLPVLG